MTQTRAVTDWMREQSISLHQLIEGCGLEKKIVEAIVEGRYLPSPRQRKRVADALEVEVDQIAWGHANAVDHMYGHGPQFGRTP